MKDKTKIKRYLHYLSYSIAAYSGQFLNVASAILVRRLLEPPQMGALTVAQTLYSYLDLSHLGARYALDKEVPMSEEGKHNIILKETFEIAMFFYALTLFITFSIMTLKYGLSKITITYLLLEIASVPFFVVNFKKAFLRAKQEIGAMRFFAFFYPLVFSSLRIILLKLLGYWGYVAGYIVGNYIFYIVFSKKYPVKLKIKLFKINYNFYHLKIGFPMFLNAVVSVIAATLDRWIVFNFYGEKILGIYSATIMISSFMTLFPNTLSEVIFPKLLTKLKYDRRSFVSYFNKIILLSFIIVLFAAIISYIVVPYVIRFFIPKYAAATLASQIIVFQAPFIMISSICYYSLVGLERYHLPYLLNLLLVALIIVISYFQKYKGIIGISSAVVLARVVIAVFFYIATIYIAKKRI